MSCGDSVCASALRLENKLEISTLPTCGIAMASVGTCSGIHSACGPGGCGAHACGQHPGGTRIDCIVQEVNIRGCHAAAPALTWLLGHTRLLYVDIAPVCKEQLSRRTGTGILAQGGRSRSEVEVWVFGISVASTDSEAVAPMDRGELLSIDVAPPADFRLRVFGSYVSWHVAFGLQAPLELTGEGRFEVHEDQLRSEVSVPLFHHGVKCGDAFLVVMLHVECQKPKQGHLIRKGPGGRSVPNGVWSEEDSRPFT